MAAIRRDRTNLTQCLTEHSVQLKSSPKPTALLPHKLMYIKPSRNSTKLAAFALNAIHH